MHRCRIFSRLWEPIFTQAMSRTRTPKNFAKNTIFMPQFWPGDVKLNIMRSPDQLCVEPCKSNTCSKAELSVDRVLT